MDRATQTSGLFVNLAITLLALFSLFMGVVNVLEDAFALSGSGDYISVQSSGTSVRTGAWDLSSMKLHNI